MKYIFNFENRDKPLRFNREKLLLAAMQDAEQLYYMMDTQYEGIYQAEAAERKRRYGANSYRELLRTSHYRMFPQHKEKINAAFATLATQKIAVFRRGLHFYTEVEMEDIVPGDVLFLCKGDVIPADLRIIFSKELAVDQNIYPGAEAWAEKQAVYKNEVHFPEALTDIPNLCFAGSTVVAGLARGIVIGTGATTYLSHLLRV